MRLIKAILKSLLDTILLPVALMADIQNVTSSKYVYVVHRLGLLIDHVQEAENAMKEFRKTERIR